MLIKDERLKNLDIVSMRSGHPVAKVTRPIIDPHKLIVKGFYTTNKPDDILLSSNIRELNRKQIIINDIDDFSATGDLPRLEEILEIGYDLPGKKVVTHSKRRLGKVSSYVLDTISYQIQKVHVHQPIWQSLSGSMLIIDRKQIVEVSNDAIIVSDASIKSGALATQRSMS